jgi:Mor family transcriptional regulator
LILCVKISNFAQIFKKILQVMNKDKILTSIALSVGIILSFLIAGLSFYYTKGPTNQAKKTIHGAALSILHQK